MLMTVAEVAEMLQLTTARVYDLCRQKVLPCIYVGRQLRFSKEMLEAWILRGGSPLPGGWRRDPN